MKCLDNLIGEPETIANILLALRKYDEITQADFAKNRYFNTAAMRH